MKRGKIVFKIRYTALVVLLVFCTVVTGCRANDGGKSSKASGGSSAASTASVSAVAVSALSSTTSVSSANASAADASSAPMSPAGSAAVSSGTTWKSVYPKAFPVLMYHSITTSNSDYEANPYMRIMQSVFKNQMQWLSDNGYRIVTLDTLYGYLQKNEPFPAKTVALTFDDGYMDFYVNVFPVLKQYGYKATVFMIAGEVDQYAYMTSAQIKELSAWGIDIESHTMTHPHLPKLTYAKQLEEVSDAKKDLETLTGKQVLYIAYPYGEYNADTLRALKAVGYRIAFTMDGPWNNPSTILYKFPRMYVDGQMSHFLKLFSAKATS